jgi:hypothetical protein
MIGLVVQAGAKHALHRRLAARGGGALVTQDGQTWDNTASPADVWEPGVFGWEIIT